ncbi:hypothetical protein [Clostridium sporogenes]
MERNIDIEDKIINVILVVKYQITIINIIYNKCYMFLKINF